MNLIMHTVCGPEATTGTMQVNGLTFATMELPWRDNDKDISCVPAGTYQLIPYTSPVHGKTWRLHNAQLGVWGMTDTAPDPIYRTEVEVHSGNFASDSEACILPGMTSGQLFNPKSNTLETAVIDSDVALDKLRTLLDDTSEEDTLTIVREGLYPQST